MATTARAALFTGPKATQPYLEFVELPIREPAAGEAVVEILAAHVRSYVSENLSGERPFRSIPPMVPGNGGIGVIRAIGPGNTLLEVGQLVAIDPAIRARDNAISPDTIIMGFYAAGPGGKSLHSVWKNGTWAEKAVIPFEVLFPIPPSLQEKYEVHTLASLPGYCISYGGLWDSLSPGETIAITGATGPFGASTVAVALAMGARRVIASGRNEATLKTYVEKFGPRVVPLVTTGDEAQDTANFKKAAGEGYEIDVSFDILPPTAPFATARAAINAVRTNGTVVLMGGVRANIEFPYSQLVFNNLTIKGRFMNSRSAVVQLLAMMEAGLLDPMLIEYKTFCLDQIEESLQWAKTHAGPFEATVLLPNAKSNQPFPKEQ
ncbi:hypothetical protein EMPS_08783 [Entomortierella parvispora]|uniref:Alcohol dehydrogenase n=1 Tax=Entomortierella parvispora TaxID=205924 RepID=A0A9P3HGR4_9FUNG|nr:hypothetical protein EMPS_08783 [Entomortierella parvispora]